MEAYPLHWPQGYPRTSNRTHSRFNATVGLARDCVLEEIRRLGGTEPIISSNIPVKKDGFLYAAYKQPEDPGIAVYFMYQGSQVVLACDKWINIADNLQAIKKTIEAMRGIDRWGVSDLLNRAFTGFKALPQTSSIEPTNHTWWNILGCKPNASDDIVKKCYREMVKKYHPDTGVSSDSVMFNMITKAYNQYNSFKQ